MIHEKFKAPNYLIGAVRTHGRPLTLSPAPLRPILILTLIFLVPLLLVSRLRAGDVSIAIEGCKCNETMVNSAYPAGIGPSTPAAGAEEGWPVESMRPDLLSTIPQSLHKCIDRHLQKQHYQRTAYDSLPELGIVIVSTADKIDAVVAHNIETWAHLHGYYFHHAIINTEDWSVLEDGSKLLHFFTARWRYIQQRHWGKYKWILALDGDTLALNLHNNISEFLNMKEDIVLHMSTNHEIASGIALMRSTSFTYCFLEHWIRLGTLPSTKYNWDNGDIIQTVLDIADPAQAKTCSRKRYSYFYYIECLTEIYSHLRTLHEKLPIRILFPFSGFWRPFHGLPHQNCITPLFPEETAHMDAIYTCSFPHDVLGHSCKRLAELWPLALRLEAVNGGAVERPLGCQAMSSSKELEVMTECCFLDAHACNQSGINVCAKANPGCSFLNWEGLCGWPV